MNLYEGIKKNLNESVDFSDDDLSWLVELVENQMNPIYDAVDSRFNTNMGYDNSFCTDLCEYVEELRPQTQMPDEAAFAKIKEQYNFIVEKAKQIN